MSWRMPWAFTSIKGPTDRAIRAQGAFELVPSPMQNTNYAAADKNIVERRKPRNRLGSILPRAGANGVSEGEDTSRFETELLHRHARQVWQFRFAHGLAVLIASWIGWNWLKTELIILWAVAAGILAGSHILAAKVFLNPEHANINIKRWTRLFYLANFGQAVIWSVLFAIAPLQEGNQLMVSIAVSAAMVLMALALVSDNYLKFGVLVGTLPFAMVLAIRLGLQEQMASLGLATVLVGACFFFEHLGALMRRSWIKHLQSEVVRDQLIVELEAATAISDEARRRAEEANLAKSRFLATMSHELRTPLNAILGFSEVMSAEVMGPLNNEHYKEYVADIHSSGSHLLNLINEILDLSRVEAGRYEMNEEPVKLAHVVEDAKHMVKLKASDKKISINLELHPQLPALNADARAIRQIVLNLMSNALKFTPQGGLVTVRVGWTAGGGQYVSIRDTGPGIPEEEIPVVLSSFGQGSIAIKSAEQGTGLGLPIVQALVHMHQGHFELKSKLREGTEVIASFPRTRVLAQAEGPGPSGPIHRPAGNMKFVAKRQQVSAPPMVGVANAENTMG